MQILNLHFLSSCNTCIYMWCTLHAIVLSRTLQYRTVHTFVLNINYIKYSMWHIFLVFNTYVWFIKQQQYHVKSSDNLVFRHHDLPTQLLKNYFEKMCNVLMNGNFVNVKKSFPAVVWHKSVVMANNGWDLCWENIKPITFQFYF